MALWYYDSKVLLVWGATLLNLELLMFKVILPIYDFVFKLLTFELDILYFLS